MDDTLLTIYLIDKAMLDVDPARIASSQVSHEFFETWRSSERVFSNDLKQQLSLRFKPGRRQFFRIFLRLS